MQFQGASQTLTHGSQRRCLTVNVQLRHLGSTLQDFIKQGDPICELNYRGTKCEIKAKVGDQKCNLAKNYSVIICTSCSTPFS